MHGAAAEWVRVRDERGIECVRRTGVEQSFEAADGAAKVFNGLDVGTERRHKDECTWEEIPRR
jgi:hypothetical protein